VQTGQQSRGNRSWSRNNHSTSGQGGKPWKSEGTTREKTHSSMVLIDED
jgi:hypothetical protein